MDKKDHITFLYESIDDSQTTIRAIDTKVGFFLILILSPATIVCSNNYKMLHVLFSHTWCIYLLVANALSWGVTIIFLALTIKNRLSKKLDSKTLKINEFFFKIKVENDKEFDEVYEKFNNYTSECIVKELIYEKAKLSELLSLKIRFFKLSCILLIVFFCLFAISIVLFYIV